ncbi:hypothetical protein [Pantoea sp. GD03673]|uniref:hypothetical protein n=1 Tax=Pantoea sp. GD03673 TaxID=2975364 RepID=UPI00244846A9|nr:hypothetical protein [Pantoea sp. GD03673]MDH2066052.1 hypothetical protein [Pantoea sp. GD03673]
MGAARAAADTRVRYFTHLITRPSQGIEPKSTMKISKIELPELFSKENLRGGESVEIDLNQSIVF